MCQLKLNLSFKWTTFIIYSIFIGFIIAGLITSIYIYINRSLTNNAIKNIEQTAINLTSQLDTLVNSMESLADRITYNKGLQEILLDTNTLEYQKSNINYFDIYPEQKNKAEDILFSLAGAKSLPRRITIFNGERNYVAFSTKPYALTNELRFTDSNFPLKDLTTQNDTMILTPSIDLWAEAGNNEPVISLYKKILYTWGNSLTPIGYVEIQEPYSKIKKLCEYFNYKDAQIYILDQKGSLVYPNGLQESTVPEYIFNKIRQSNEKSYLITKSPKDGSSMLVYKTESPVTRWSTVLVVPKRTYLAPVNKVRNLIIAASALLIIFSLAAILLITNKLTAPILRLSRSLKTVSLQNPLLNIDWSNNNEINVLHSAFNKTLKNLNEAMNETIEARARELEAHFLALQAQMNPHFLYNSFMGISAVALEDNNEKIAEMCSNLANMLRYTAAFDKTMVPLMDEINNAEQYLTILKFRFEDSLSYSVNVPSGSDYIIVPKFILQPIIENSFEHGFSRKKPPYKIELSFEINEHSWSFSIEDNGGGFSHEAITKFNAGVQAVDRLLLNSIYKNNLKLGGMGLINIYTRLKLLYKDDVVFHIVNLPNDSGSIVTIGGKRTAETGGAQIV